MSPREADEAAWEILRHFYEENQLPGDLPGGLLDAVAVGLRAAVTRAVENERERIYKAAEIRWLYGGLMEAIRRDLLTPD